MADGTTAWRTERAAEYSAGLCDLIANAYLADAAQSTGEVVPPTYITADGATDPLQPDAIRQRREQENTEAIGGLRNPAVSVTKSRVGPQLDAACAVDCSP